jgi:predicted ATPase with chaperone activity
MKYRKRIADLAGFDAVQPVHLVGALQYRPRLMLE